MDLLSTIVARADPTHILLSFVVLILLAMLREQIKSAAERDVLFSKAMDNMSEVITALRVETAARWNT